MFNFEDEFKLIPEQTIVCVGDLMLDDFVYGEVSRISPEAPAPILAVKRNELTVGGAGNVARNIASLGARCIFLGVVGEDEASRTLMRALAVEPLLEPHPIVDSARPTTRRGGDADSDVTAGAAELRGLLGPDAVVVSLSDAGLMLVPENGGAIHVPAYPVKLRDTSGAGDTVVAALAVLLATKADYEP